MERDLEMAKSFLTIIDSGMDLKWMITAKLNLNFKFLFIILLFNVDFFLRSVSYWRFLEDAQKYFPLFSFFWRSLCSKILRLHFFITGCFTKSCRKIGVIYFDYTGSPPNVPSEIAWIVLPQN